MSDWTHLVVELLLREVTLSVQVAGKALLPVFGPVLVEELKVVGGEVAVHEVAVTNPVQPFAGADQSAEITKMQEFHDFLKRAG